MNWLWILLVAYSLCFAIRVKPKLYVYFLDVGYGNCVFIETPNGNKILIDGGPERVTSENYIIPFLKERGIKRIDKFLISCISSESIGGIIPIFENFDIGEIIIPPVDFFTKAYEEVLEFIMQKQDEAAAATGEARERLIADALSGKLHFEVTQPQVGDLLLWDRDITVQVLGPARIYKNTRSDINNNSIVIKLVFGRYSLLFPGNIEKEAETDLIKSGTKLQSVILKVPQAGSEFSSSPIFIQNVAPSYSVIQVGSNPFGLPSNSVLERYEKAGSKIYRTDSHGKIVFSTDGITLDVKIEKEAIVVSRPEKKEKPILEETKPEVIIPKKININTATVDDLLSLPSISAFKAQMILKHRNKYGPFNSIEALKHVIGIDSKTYEKIKDKITVE